MILVLDPRLLTFLTLVEEKNYTKTASKLYITQPSVTHHIKALEKELNVSLFKDQKNFILSKEGEIILNYAKECLISDKKLHNMLNNVSNNVKTTIAVTPYLSDVIVKRKVFSKISERIKDYNVYILPKDIILEKLKLGEIDIGILDDNFEDTIYDFIEIGKTRVSLVTLREGKFREYKKITRAQFKEAKIILSDSSSGLYKHTMEVFKKNNIVINMDNVIRTSSTDLLLDLVVENDAIGFIYDENIRVLDNPIYKKIELYNFDYEQNIYMVFDKNTFNNLNYYELLKDLGENDENTIWG